MLYDSEAHFITVKSAMEREVNQAQRFSNVSKNFVNFLSLASLLLLPQ
jgi:hypothetical protein